MHRLLLCAFAALYLGTPAAAQRVKPAPHIDRGEFVTIDARVAKTGAMKGYVVKSIVTELLDTSWTKLEKLRALYMWEISNISFDCRAYHHPGNYAANASVALNERKTTSKGYALFFKALCDVSNINCYVVEGVVRSDADEIGKLDEDNRHYWNIAVIDDIQYLVDATWGAGTTDAKKKNFTASKTDAWWLPNRELFAMTHFPDKKQWQLLDNPVTKSEFSKAPIVDANAFVIGVLPGRGASGLLRGREDTVAYLNYQLQRPDNIRNVSISIDEGNPVPVEYDLGGNGMTVKIPYNKSGKQSYGLYVNGKLTLTYNAQVRPYKRPKPKVAAPGKTA